MMPQPEEESPLETSNGKYAESSSSVYDTMSSSDNDNEPTPES